MWKTGKRRPGANVAHEAYHEESPVDEVELPSGRPSQLPPAPPAGDWLQLASEESHRPSVRFAANVAGATAGTLSVVALAADALGDEGSPHSAPASPPGVEAEQAASEEVATSTAAQVRRTRVSWQMETEGGAADGRRAPFTSRRSSGAGRFDPVPADEEEGEKDEGETTAMEATAVGARRRPRLGSVACEVARIEARQPQASQIAAGRERRSVLARRSMLAVAQQVVRRFTGSISRGSQTVEVQAEVQAKTETETTGDAEVEVETLGRSHETGEEGVASGAGAVVGAHDVEPEISSSGEIDCDGLQNSAADGRWSAPAISSSSCLGAGGGDRWSAADYHSSVSRQSSDSAVSDVSPVGSARSDGQREKARRGFVRDRRIELWLPESVLHRVQGDWVLIVDEQLQTAGNTGRRRSQAGKRTKQMNIPVHSLGVHLLPSCCCSRAASSRILVRIDPTEVPKGMKFALTPARLRGGGPLGTAQRPSFTCLKALAWLYNLTVLLYGATFLLFSQLIVLEEALPSWTGAVVTCFVVSCVVGFVVSDILVCALVACLPFKAKRTRAPLEHGCNLVSNFIEGFFEA